MAAEILPLLRRCLPCSLASAFLARCYVVQGPLFCAPPLLPIEACHGFQDRARLSPRQAPMGLYDHTRGAERRIRTPSRTPRVTPCWRPHCALGHGWFAQLALGTPSLPSQCHHARPRSRAHLHAERLPHCPGRGRRALPRGLLGHAPCRLTTPLRFRFRLQRPGVHVGALAQGGAPPLSNRYVTWLHILACDALAGCVGLQVRWRVTPSIYG